MKKRIFAVVLAAAAIMTACTAGEGDKTAETNVSNVTNAAVEVANPFTEHGSLEDMESAVGFSMTLPACAESFGEVIYRADTESGMAEIICRDGEKELRLRKSAGEGDISGNYSAFADVREVNVGDITVTFKGEGEKVMLATWQYDGYAYSADSSDGLDSGEMTELVSEFAEPSVGDEMPFAGMESPEE